MRRVPPPARYWPGKVRRYQHGERALEHIEKQRGRGEPLRPVRSTLVAPILPEPMSRMSGPPVARVSSKPNGIEPSK